MLRLDWSEKFDNSLNIISVACPIVATVIGAILKIENGYFENPHLLAIISAIRNRAWWLILLFSLIGILSQLIRSRIGTNVVWQTVQYLLDQYREELFGSKDDQAQFFHRITLFKHVKWHWGLVRWPWSGWMIPVARSGNKTRKYIAKFRASSDDPDNAEGIAGQAWANERPLQIYGLPDINTNDTSEDDLNEYASKGLVQVSWLQKRKKKNKNNARSMLGIPVEVKGKTWGAMVVDSRRADEILSETALKKQKYKNLVNILGKLLEKV
jgi:hypothetical protein